MALWRGLAQPARYAALAAGGLPVLAFPAPNLEFLAWVGLVPGLLLLRAAPTGREAAVRGWWFGAGYLLTALYWLTPNLGPALLLVVIVLGAPWTGVGYASWRLLRAPAKSAPRPAPVTPGQLPGPQGPAHPDPTHHEPGHHEPGQHAPGQHVPVPAPTVPSAGPAAEALPPAARPGPASADRPDAASAATAGSRVTTPESAGRTAAIFPKKERFAWARNLFAVPGPTVLRAAAALIVLPSSWVVIDWIRSWQGIGGPWAVFGASQWQHPVVLALAAVGGIWLVSFALVASNTGFVIALTAARWTGRVVGLAAAAVAIAAGPAAYGLTAAQYAQPPAGHLDLALVQPGLRPGPGARLAAESRMTRGIRGADMIVWSESSVGYDLYTDRPVFNQLVRLSTRVGRPLLVSQDALSPTKAKSKVAVLIGRAGIEGTYTKTRLVPFGEYIPFRSLLGWLSSVSKAASQNMIAGHGAHVLHAVLPDGRRLTFGVLICFESSFPDMSAVDVRQGAQVLIYQTSDSTFQGSWALAQHASLVAIRAAESGRPAVQAALTGDSAAFDSRGRLLAWMGSSQRGVLRVTLALPPSSVRTPFDRYGDYVPWLAIAVVVIGILIAIDTRGLMRRLMRR